MPAVHPLLSQRAFAHTASQAMTACVFGLRSLTLACLLAKAEKHLSLSCFPIPIYCEGTLGSLQFPCQAVYGRHSRGVAQFIAPLSSFVKCSLQTIHGKGYRKKDAYITAIIILANN